MTWHIVAFLTWHSCLPEMCRRGREKSGHIHPLEELFCSEDWKRRTLELPWFHVTEPVRALSGLSNLALGFASSFGGRIALGVECCGSHMLANPALKRLNQADSLKLKPAWATQGDCLKIQAQ